MFMACLYFFFLMTSYFILRPIRDAMAVAAGTSKLPYLFLGTLIAMLICNPLFSSLVVRFPVRKFIVITYQFFALNLVLFYVAQRMGTNELVTGLLFFWWTSVYSLFVVSVFWALMADVFRSEQAKRLFGFIGIGGTLGSITGSAVTATLARTLGPVNLLLVSAVLLEVAVLMVVLFPAKEVRLATADENSALFERETIGGSMWSGFTHVTKSPYLLAIALFLVLYVFGNTVLYFQQTEIIGKYFASKADRTQVLAQMEFAAQTLTVVLQFLVTGRFIRWFGLTAALVLMPVLSMIGFAALGASALGLTPLLGTFIVFSVLRRSTNFALTNPSMEVLFTVVSREDKYKAKSFIETFVYRAGDQLAAWAYAGLVLLGLGLTGIAWLSVPLAGVFVATGVWLGRRHNVMARAESPGAVA